MQDFYLQEEGRATCSSKMLKTIDPTPPILSNLGDGAIILGTLEVQVVGRVEVPKTGGSTEYRAPGKSQETPRFPSKGSFQSFELKPCEPLSIFLRSQAQKTCTYRRI